MFLILSDISYIIKKMYKIVIAYLLLLFFFFWMLHKGLNTSTSFVDSEYLSYVLDLIFGLKFEIINVENIFKTVMTLLNYLFFNYISLSLFVKDYDMFDNYFTRITFQKWFIYKIIINTIFIFIFNLILYFITLYFIDYQLLPFIVIIKKTLLLIIIITYVYIIMTYFYKNKLITIFLTILGIIPFLYSIDVRTLNIGILLSILLILMIIVIVYFRKKRFSDLEIERGMS